MGLNVGDKFGEHRSGKIISICFAILNVTMTSFGQGKPNEKLHVTSGKAKLANYLTDLPKNSEFHRVAYLSPFFAYGNFFPTTS